MKNMLEAFGKNYFSELELKSRVPSSIFKEFKAVQRGEKELSISVAEVIANAVKNWATEKGATHFTHWFQPLTELTAEKHESFISVSSDGNILSQFSGKELIKGEADSSSFPNGGLRSTFEARGYTAWDISSPMFLRGPEKAKTLFIPTALIGYHGETLDKKVPLLRSINTVTKEALRIKRALGDYKSSKIDVTLGIEQEYFLIEKSFLEKREDLMFTGRTLFGSLPPKGQELSDHYYGALKEKVEVFMAELDAEMWQLGVMAKTKHNEVAPNQFELAVMYSSANVAADQNQLCMDMIKRVADRHGLAALLHEKPFEKVNGSGKHCNWSLSTDTGENLLDPENVSKGNLDFLVFLTAIIEGVDRYGEVLRVSTATPGNDHRLGGSEAPPAIISIFIGEPLQELLENVDKINVNKTKTESIELGTYNFPKIPKDSSDRNRTSPFAFTGNKFEYRMPGSSASPATPVFMINTIVADILREYADILEKIEDKSTINDEVIKLVKDRYNKHKRIIFNGNGYDDAWVKEAENRGLPNLSCTVEALPVYKKDSTIELFERNGVLSREELNSIFVIYTERYNKQLKIETTTAIRMARNEIYPAIMRYMNNIATSIRNIQEALGSDYEQCVAGDKKHLLKVINGKDHLRSSLAELEKDFAEAISIKDQYERAKYYNSHVVPRLKHLREWVDVLEHLCEKSLWPFPVYEDLLFKL
ncbi:glutamine synthetase III [Fusobacterium perfoetens]|uniref:glutamine synthetase III family protein n=1 Tax=Fusobacterium perfoetens TaxID=852 RepID=UPI000480CCA6|nr:glutamine synthetase III [Fusobacterium perfoetens]MCI6153008.1 glutamine synthetase III [Fusobacterium perfoetens]MDY3237405.1 glutamine synthetase III [Fusobacterium perfoetens]